MKKIYIAFCIVAILLLGSITASAQNNDNVLKTKKGFIAIDKGDAADAAAHAEVQSRKRVIILYKDRISDENLDILKNLRANIRNRHNIISAITAYVDAGDIEKIKLDDRVKAVFEDTRVYALLDESVPKINADQVHSAGSSGAGVKVCIVDTGVEKTHTSLAGKVIAEQCYCAGSEGPIGCCPNGLDTDVSATDDNGHGTHVAGIVASNDATYKGVAYSASLMSAKVLDASGSGWTSDVISGIEWCVANNADIISMSLGSEEAFIGPCDSEPSAAASNNAVGNGVVVLAASGNKGYINAISSPACGSKVIAVGAVDKNDGRTPYSNEGTELDVVAPGSSIHSTVPTGNCQLCNPTGFATLSGTSMATPHASGVAALILEANNSLNPAQVRSILENTAFDLGTSGFDTIYGHGRIDAYAAYLAASSQTPGPLSYIDIFSDNFSDGIIDQIKWTANNAQENNKCGFQSSSMALHFSGSGNRNVATKALDVSNGGRISFYLKFGTLTGSSSGCENVDNGEDVVLEYSANNGPWSNIKTYDTEAYTSFSLIQEDIPAGAKTSSTIFRWRQLSHSGSTWDNWAIDDVLVQAINPEPECSIDSDCDDSLFCNGVEACQSGMCSAGTVVNCLGSGQCNTAFCDEASDSCIIQPSNEGLSCSDGLFCNAGETCQSGVCTGGSLFDCSLFNLLEIATCNNNPDNNPFTWDFAAAYTSVCNEASDSCTQGNYSFTHTCDANLCGACSSDSDCPLTDCSPNDGCYSGTYREYNSVSSSCAGCECLAGLCNSYNELITDADGDGADTECELDCNDSNNSIFPGAADSACNGIDNDCDGLIDEGYLPIQTTCGVGACASTGQLQCQSGSEINTCIPAAPSAETCNNIDDDCNGLVDDGISCGIQCWEGNYKYLRRNNEQFKKFCKCAQGTYSFVSYSSVSGRRTVYEYINSKDNELWSTRAIANTGVSSVRCADNKWYNANIDYFR